VAAEKGQLLGVILFLAVVGFFAVVFGLGVGLFRVFHLAAGRCLGRHGWLTWSLWRRIGRLDVHAGKQRDAAFFEDGALVDVGRRGVEAPKSPSPPAPGQPHMPPEALASGEVEDPEEADDDEADPDAEDDGEEADDGEEEDDAEELTLLGRHDHINFKPPKGVRAACKRGVQLYEEGHGGDGLRPATIRWARRLAAGNDITPDKARLMRAWLARHASDRRPNWDNPPTPGYVAWLLWGGDDAVGWSNKLVRQLDAADKDATDARPEANAMALAGKDRARQAVVDGMQWSDSLAGIAAAEAHDPIRAHARDVAAVIEAATDYEDF
jgi:hypothetical protein